MEKFDYVDIGTCDFDVADGVFSTDKNYLLVEPMIEYLNRLPSGDHIKKENAACSDNNGIIDIFYVPEEDIIFNQLPLWMKGCSKIGEPHKIVLDYFSSNHVDFSIIKCKSINKIKFSELIDKHQISEIGILKIDTEGHDHVILKEAAKLIKQGKLFCESIVVEYIIGRYGNTECIDEIAYSLRKVFPNIKIQSENLTLSK